MQSFVHQSGRVIRAMRRHVGSEIAYIIDYLISRRVVPSEGLIISGFWRSGTTWLQQSLASLMGAKTVFEPFDPKVLLSLDLLPYEKIPRKDVGFLRTYMPFYDKDLSSNVDITSFLDRAFRADLRGSWVRMARMSMFDAFRQRVILKMVRGQLCLSGIQKAFSCPIVHIYRDPRAIIASIRRNHWWKGWLDSLSLYEQLILPKDGREKFFNKWIDDILRYERGEVFGKVVVYWALTEIFVKHCHEHYGTHIVFVCYDKLHRDTDGSLKKILLQAGIKSDRCYDLRFDIPSPTTINVRRNLKFRDRIASWKNDLESREINLIESIARYFGFEDRLEDGQGR